MDRASLHRYGLKGSPYLHRKNLQVLPQAPTAKAALSVHIWTIKIDRTSGSPPPAFVLNPGLPVNPGYAAA